MLVSINANPKHMCIMMGIKYYYNIHITSRHDMNKSLHLEFKSKQNDTSNTSRVAEYNSDIKKYQTH